MFGTSQATCWESGSLKLFDFTHKHSSRCEAASSSLFRDDFPHDPLPSLPRNLKTQVSRGTARRQKKFYSLHSVEYIWINQEKSYQNNYKTFSSLERKGLIFQHMGVNQHIPVHRDAQRRKSINLDWFCHPSPNISGSIFWLSSIQIL